MTGQIVQVNTTQCWRSQPQPSTRLELPLQPNRKAWLQLIDGAITLDEQPLQRGDGLGFESAPGQTIVSSSTSADLLLFELQ